MKKELDLSKLPVAARHEIERLRAEVEYHKQHIAAMDSGNTNIKATIGNQEVRLPNDADIEFSIDGERLEVSIVRGRLQIRSNTGMLAVYPSVTNTITIVSVHD